MLAAAAIDYAGRMEELIVLLVLAGLGAFGLFLLYALTGIIIVQPFTQVVVLRFGKYKRTIEDNGLGYVFPLGRKLYRISSQVVTTNLPHLVVVESSGNPIEVSAMCSYRVRDAARAALEVENYPLFVNSLATVVVKNICAHYPYEAEDPGQPNLKHESEVVTRHLITTLQELLVPAGVEVLDLRLNDLTYTAEIAQSMLLRQQAAAMVDARRTMVRGATETVRGALGKMSSSGLQLPPHALESLTTNLMMVLCSGERVQTVMPIAVTLDPTSPTAQVRS